MVCEHCKLGLDMCECKPFTGHPAIGEFERLAGRTQRTGQAAEHIIVDEPARYSGTGAEALARVQRYEVSRIGSLREQRMIEDEPGREADPIDTTHPDYCGFCHSYHKDPGICETGPGSVMAAIERHRLERTEGGVLIFNAGITDTIPAAVLDHRTEEPDITAKPLDWEPASSDQIIDDLQALVALTERKPR